MPQFRPYHLDFFAVFTAVAVFTAGSGPGLIFGSGKGLGRPTSSLIFIAWIFPLCRDALMISSITHRNTLFFVPGFPDLIYFLSFVQI